MSDSEARSMHKLRLSLMRGDCEFYGLSDVEKNELLMFISCLDSPLDTKDKTEFPDYGVSITTSKNGFPYRFGGFIEVFDTSADVCNVDNIDRCGINQHKRNGMIDKQLENMYKSKQDFGILGHVHKTYSATDDVDNYYKHLKSKYAHHMESFRKSDWYDDSFLAKYKCFMIDMQSSLNVISDNNDEKEYYLSYDSELLHYIYDNSEHLDYIIFISPHLDYIVNGGLDGILDTHYLKSKVEIMKIKDIPNLTAYENPEKYQIYGLSGFECHDGFVF